MKILTPEGREKLDIAKYEIKYRSRNFVEWCSNHLLLVIFATICWSITPLMFILADIERGYDAVGGEIFIPILPIIAYVIGRAIEDDHK